MPEKEACRVQGVQRRLQWDCLWEGAFTSLILEGLTFWDSELGLLPQHLSGTWPLGWWVSDGVIHVSCAETWCFQVAHCEEFWSLIILFLLLQWGQDVSCSKEDKGSQTLDRGFSKCLRALLTLSSLDTMGLSPLTVGSRGLVFQPVK